MVFLSLEVGLWVPPTPNSHIISHSFLQMLYFLYSVIRSGFHIENCMLLDDLGSFILSTKEENQNSYV